MAISQTHDIEATIVRQASRADMADPDLYRLTLTCKPDTHEAGLQLAWSPATPQQGRIMSVNMDGNTTVTYKIEGKETFGMANGPGGTSGPGAIMLDISTIPEKALTISNLFGEETVVFPFDSLPAAARESFSACYTRSK